MPPPSPPPPLTACSQSADQPVSHHHHAAGTFVIFNRQHWTAAVSLYDAAFLPATSLLPPKPPAPPPPPKKNTVELFVLTCSYLTHLMTYMLGAHTQQAHHHQHSCQGPPCASSAHQSVSQSVSQSHTCSPKLPSSPLPPPAAAMSRAWWARGGGGGGAGQAGRHPRGAGGPQGRRTAAAVWCASHQCASGMKPACLPVTCVYGS